MTVDTNAPERLWASFNSGGSLALARTVKADAQSDTWGSMFGPYEFIRLDLHEAAVRKAGEVKVRALVWEKFTTFDGYDRWKARTPFSKPYIADDRGWWHVIEPLHPCDGLEAAQAAAQADYERRIREALE